MIDMSMDRELLEEFKKELADKYTAEELSELLGLDVWDIIEMFEDKIVELKWR